MKEQLTSFAQLTVVFIFALLLQACGGSDNAPNYSISADTNNLSFANEFRVASDDSASINVTYNGEGILVGFAPEATPVPWLNFRTVNTGENSVTVHFDVVNAQFLTADQYSTVIRLATGDSDTANLRFVDVSVSLLVWQLDTDQSVITFAAPYGTSSLEAQRLTITSESNQWRASVDVDWLSINATQGSGDGTIEVSADLSSFSAPGLYQGNMTLTEITTGDKKIIPIELGLDSLYLQADQAQLAFTKTPRHVFTSKTITITDNASSAIAWQAMSSADWLRVNPDVETNQLMVNLDENLLPTESLTTATITIASVVTDDTPTDDVARFTQAETITVTLYQDDTTEPVKVVEDVTVNNNALASAPLLPYVYVGVNNELRTYHQYSGELLNTLVVAPEGTLLQDFVMHPEGNLLFTQAEETIPAEAEGDATTTELHRYRIDLTNNTVTELSEATIAFDPIDVIRVDGRYYVVTQTLEFADINLQQQFWDRENAFFARKIAMTDAGNTLFALDGNTNSFKRFELTSNDFISTPIAISQTHEYLTESLAQNELIADFIVDETGRNIYLISPTQEWITFDGNTFTEQGLLESNTELVALSVLRSQNDRPMFIRFDPSTGFLADVYDASQQLTFRNNIGVVQPVTSELSADNQRLVFSASSNNSLNFADINQFEQSAMDVNFAITTGNSAPSSQTIDLNGLSDSWQASTSAEWLTLTQLTNGENPQLEIAINTDAITTSGLYTATIVIFDPVSETSQTIQVSLAVDDIKLISNFVSLSFNDTPSHQQLAHTVAISTNSEQSINWQSSTTVSWLTVIDDVANNQITLTADPNLVANNNFYQGTVTISSADNNAVVATTINVSLNRADTDAVEVDIADIATSATGIVLDPLRPRVYVVIGDRIASYDLLTGALLSTINSPVAGAELTNLVIHPDGSLMLASSSEVVTDEQGVNTTVVHHFTVSLTDMTISEIDNESIDIDYRPVAIIIAGQTPIVVTETQEFAELDLARKVWDNQQAFFSSRIANQAHGSSAYVFNTTTNSLLNFAVSYNSYAETPITVNQQEVYQNDQLVGLSSFALSSDGLQLYTANNVEEWASFDGTQFQAQGLLHGDSNIVSLRAATDSANNSYFYRFDPLKGFTISQYDQNQQQVWQQTLNAGASQSYLSPDYQRIVSYDANAQTLTIRSMQ